MRWLPRRIAVVVLVWAGGCAFPIFNADAHDARDSQQLAYAPRSQGRASREPRADRESRSRRSAQPAAPRSYERTERRVRDGSVLAPALANDPPAPEGGFESCYDALADKGVRFEVTEASGVRMPLRLLGPIGGVTFEPANDSDTHAILDCRLAHALVAWAAELRARGVVRVEHYSMYRPGAHVAGKRRISGHAHGLAIDAARFTLHDGTLLDVLTDWEGRERRGSPCPMRPDEGFGSRMLRTLTCDAIERQLFQVVITPHHDRAHANHVHLELKPEVDWTYVR